MTSFDLDACLRCAACELAATRQNVVVSRGNPKAPLMLIGEAPVPRKINPACRLRVDPDKSSIDC